MTADPTPDPDHPSPADAAPVQEQWSAWLDGELSAVEIDRVAVELLQRRDAQRCYQEWCVVGDALRSHEVLAEHSPRLCARIALALQDEPALLAPRALPRVFGRQLVMRHVASGLAVAAAAAVLVLVAVPQLRNDGGAAAGASIARADASRAPVAVAAGAPLAEPGRAARNAPLDPYLQAHREISDPGVMPAAAVYLRYGAEGDR